jgi:hypothetical protein
MPDPAWARLASSPHPVAPPCPVPFALRDFCAAEIYGRLVITPPFFSEGRFAPDFPSFINHPAYFHGFASAGFAWQVLFLPLAVNVLRCWLRILPSLLAKVAVSATLTVLFLVPFWTAKGPR